MKNEMVEMTRSLNTQTCWMVGGPLTIHFVDGTTRDIFDGFVKQTPSLYERDEIKIISRGKEEIVSVDGILQLTDRNHNVFWS